MQPQMGVNTHRESGSFLEFERDRRYPEIGILLVTCTGRRVEGESRAQKEPSCARDHPGGEVTRKMSW